MPVITLVFGILPGMGIGWIVGHLSTKSSILVKGLLALSIPLISLLGYELMGIGGSNLLFAICYNAVLR